MSDERAVVPKQREPEEQIFFGGKSIAWYKAASWFAGQCFESRMLPGHIKTKEQAFFILCKGEEIGLPPTAAWAFLYPTKSQNLGIMKKGALAAVQSKATFGGYEERIELDGTPDMRAVAIATRKGFPPVVKEFTLRDAEVAGLLRRPKNRDTGKEYDGVYQAYLKDMLLSRVGCRALAVAFAAELAGCLVEGEAEDADEMAARAGRPQIAATGAQAALQGPAQRLLAQQPTRDPILLELASPAAAEELVEATLVPDKPPEVQAVIDSQIDEVFGPGPAAPKTIDPGGPCPRCGTPRNALNGCDLCAWPGEDIR